MSDTIAKGTITKGALLETWKDEIWRAQIKYGPFHSSHEGFGVLAEEVIELLEAIRTNDRAAIEKEAMQVSAVAYRIASDCQIDQRFQDRSGFKRGE